ncbi:6-phosphogluconate dehydrogenase [Nematocida homosporus]|uniref:6-phosphogluconate dehydrogenase n=1 Tax=Nematocida homosporus TaxID=1912981 RepID=UPI00221ED73F|nr:6-phosphogluconate dehydrogenase [Nematocida homosporus]KAI5187476.1 6-phosphogluconate dehydrogenase [Nematocida homosporus]
MMDIGVVGLGVMGENLILNFSDKDYSVGIFNRTVAKTKVFVESLPAERKIRGYNSLAELVGELKRPRRILLMVKAGQAVDDLLHELEGLLSAEDTVIDGGNSNYRDTLRRCEATEGKFLFLGCGISGGEEGARHGPAIMPGGCQKGWESVGEILQAVSAKTEKGEPCCQWLGPQGSGHLVKTVHNGIEYAEMQIIADFYQIMRRHHNPLEICHCFQEWKLSGTSGFLLEITQQILAMQDEQGVVIDRIWDTAEQKGTGVWTVQEALSSGSPTPIIGAAVTARVISSQKALRMKLAEVLPGGGDVTTKPCISNEEMRKAFLLCRALSYIQGFNLITSIAKTQNWPISLGMLCQIWSNGCIIRSEFLSTLAEMAKFEVLEESPVFIKIASEGIQALRRLVSFCAMQGVSVPCISESLQYYDSLRTAKSSGNLIQAMRDLFGAHTLQLDGNPEHVHLSWQ